MSVASIVWKALGQPKHYIEPFFGSGAVLLLRPNHDPKKHIETVNDKDGFICNIWRSLQHDPDEVAKWCDWPVNHADLSVRRAELIRNEGRLLENLMADEKWFDPVMAGYWIWAASCWIGSRFTSLGQRPHISDSGHGVHAIGQIPHLGDAGQGVHALGQRPHLGHAGKGVHALGQIPHLGNAGHGVQEPYNYNLYQHFRKLSERLRYVRVVCGDWKQVCGGNWQDKEGIVGIFFDPPYGTEDRDVNLYHHDSTTVASEVMQWCLERGSKYTYRIVLAGYEEHQELLSYSWTCQNWKSHGGYANTSRNGKQDNRGKKNRHREVLYFSPHCLTGGLFSGLEAE